jgi:hypothetical protein
MGRRPEQRADYVYDRHDVRIRHNNSRLIMKSLSVSRGVGEAKMRLDNEWRREAAKPALLA